MIKRILVPLDTSSYTLCSLDFACKIAKVHDAEVTGLVVLDIPEIRNFVDPFPLGLSLYSQQLEVARSTKFYEHIDYLLDIFKHKCTQENVRHQAGKRQGSPSEAILQESLFYDVMIMGMRTFFEYSPSGKPGKSLEKILNHSVTPIFAVPESYDMLEKGNKKFSALVAIDGSLPSVRAMKRFANLGEEIFTDVTILTAVESKDYADYLLNETEEYLKNYKFDEIKKSAITKNITDHIKTNFIGSVDLIVMGAHSKKGLFDFSVGSLTKFLLKESKTPVFIGL